MPDASGALTQEEKDKILKWSQEKLGNRECPSCGKGPFTLADHLVNPQIFWGDGSVRLGGGPVYPMFMIICNHCAHTRLFNSIMTGITSNETVSAEAKVDSDG